MFDLFSFIADDVHLMSVCVYKHKFNLPKFTRSTHNKSGKCCK